MTTIKQMALQDLYSIGYSCREISLVLGCCYSSVYRQIVPQRTPEELEEILDLYENYGVPVAQLAEKFNHSRRMIHVILQRRNRRLAIDRRNKEIRDLYSIKRLTYEEIAAKYKLTKQRVHQIVRGAARGGS